MNKAFLIGSLLAIIMSGCYQHFQKHDVPPHIETPNDALEELKNGNERFLKNHMIHTNYKDEILHTKTSQHPHSFILSCIDSRVPDEIIFDQGIGNIFVARVAGNFENDDILGSMEYAAKLKESKLIVVLGHTNCGAIKGAVDDTKLENLSNSLDQIKPAISGTTTYPMHESILHETTTKNVAMTVAHIRHRSKTLDTLAKENKIKIVGAIYDVATGEVHFLNI